MSNGTVPATPEPDPAPTGQVAMKATLASLFGTDDRPALASWDLTTPKGRELLQKVAETPDATVRSLVGETIEIQHVHAKVVDYVRDGSDEVIQLLRVSLVTPEGTVLACCADGVRDSINRLSMGRGFPPWNPPVKVKIVQKDTKKGYVRLVLLEVFDNAKGKK